MNRISVAQPKFAGKEREYILDCLDSSWISSNGKYIEAFEQEFARFCQTKHAITTNNGTTALHLALVALGLQPGDEVLIPAVTYIATANAVRYCGAKPVLVDVSPETLNINPEEIEKKISPKTRGIIPVHLYGHPAQMDLINNLAQKHNLFVLEDAAEAHGAEFRGKKIGGFGHCATFSFYGNKIITTGEGGMITTDDDELASKLRLFRGQGMDPKRRYWFPVIGYNYRMTNIQAAIGLAQLENIEDILAEREVLAQKYNHGLKPLASKLVLPTQAEGSKHVFWMYTIYLKEGDESTRDEVMRELDAAGIETRPVFYPLHQLPPYKENVEYPIADSWAQRGINLPTHQHLSDSDIDRIVTQLSNILDKL